MANLGFIGLGVMGGNMVDRLLSKGHSVTGFNRTKSKAEWLVKKGMKLADSPRDVATAADVIFAMVTNSAALKGIAEGPEGAGGLTAGKIFADISTVSPDVSREIAEKVRAMGADMVDCPVSGSVITLQTGKSFGDGRRSREDVRASSSRSFWILGPKSRTSATTVWRWS